MSGHVQLILKENSVQWRYTQHVEYTSWSQAYGVLRAQITGSKDAQNRRRNKLKDRLTLTPPVRNPNMKPLIVV
jgi:Tfp pilus assembly protein PilW